MHSAARVFPLQPIVLYSGIHTYSSEAYGCVPVRLVFSCRNSINRLAAKNFIVDKVTCDLYPTGRKSRQRLSLFSIIAHGCFIVALTQTVVDHLTLTKRSSENGQRKKELEKNLSESVDES